MFIINLSIVILFCINTLYKKNVKILSDITGYIMVYKKVKIEIYRAIILPIVLYGCATWSLTLRNERRQRVFENRELRKIFGPKRDKVTGEWRKLHNEEHYVLYLPPNIIRVIKSRRVR